MIFRVHGCYILHWQERLGLKEAGVELGHALFWVQKSEDGMAYVSTFSIFINS